MREVKIGVYSGIIYMPQEDVPGRDVVDGEAFTHPELATEREKWVKQGHGEAAAEIDRTIRWLTQGGFGNDETVEILGKVRARVRTLSPTVVEDPQAKLEYAESLGLEIGWMKSADKPEPYLAHNYRKGSELGKLLEMALRRETSSAEIEAAYARGAAEMREKIESLCPFYCEEGYCTAIEETCDIDADHDCVRCSESYKIKQAISALPIPAHRSEAQIRREALEEAATLCETNDEFRDAVCAKLIRALIGKEG